MGPEHAEGSWRGAEWQVKNLFELKNALRVTVEANLFENNWQAAQAGYAIVFTPRNQDGGATSFFLPARSSSAGSWTRTAATSASAPAEYLTAGSGGSAIGADIERVERLVSFVSEGCMILVRRR
ncbi:MAG: hypothetical protein ACE148_00565 [Vicinamibacterales bacterium]